MENQVVRKEEDEDEETQRCGETGVLIPVLTSKCLGTGARGMILVTTSGVS